MTTAKFTATIKDIALKAQCSTAVVSKVVNKARGNTGVSEAMRTRVMEAARELGYRPNMAARNLVQQRTRTLGLYIPPGPWHGLGYGYEGTIIRGVEEAVRKHGYQLLVLNLNGGQEPQVCGEGLIQRCVDGVLVLHAEPGSWWIRELLAVSSNIVAVDYCKPEPNLDVVCFDNAGASELAVEHLVSLGHKRIGFMGPSSQSGSMDAALRQESFLRTMAQRNLGVKPEWVCDWRVIQSKAAEGEQMLVSEAEARKDYVLSLGKEGPTAWLCFNDATAVYLMPHLVSAGIAIPRDLSVMGVDDSELSRIVLPQLTTIKHPMEEMGRRGAELLIEKSMAGEEPGGIERVGRHIMISPTLVVRGSTGKLNV